MTTSLRETTIYATPQTKNKTKKKHKNKSSKRKSLNMRERKAKVIKNKKSITNNRMVNISKTSNMLIDYYNMVW